MKIIKKQNTPKVSIVGAGPGDPDLLTLKAWKAIQSADAILYDALVSNEILAHAKTSAKTLFVGKRKGFKAFSQEKINELIVEYAFKYGHVVRLKGGDPFVFGRGKEEVDFVESFGISTEVVPGISSAIAAPSSAGIPVTLRNVARSFWVITATDAKHQLSQDIVQAANSNATVVILMGMSKLSQIVDIYKSVDRANTPVAIVQNGTKPAENVGIGTIETIESVVAEKNLSSPAVIVIGDVVDSIQKEENTTKNTWLHKELIETFE